VRNKSNGLTQNKWQLRSDHWPNHLLDCEVGLLCLANFLGLFELEKKADEKEATT
jgi:hypothetical protein